MEKLSDTHKITLIYRIYSLKYVRSATSACKDIEMRKSEFVINTQFFKSNLIFTMVGWLYF